MTPGTICKAVHSKLIVMIVLVAFSATGRKFREALNKSSGCIILEMTISAESPAVSSCKIVTRFAVIKCYIRPAFLIVAACTTRAGIKFRRDNILMYIRMAIAAC